MCFFFCEPEEVRDSAEFSKSCKLLLSIHTCRVSKGRAQQATSKTKSTGRWNDLRTLSIVFTKDNKKMWLFLGPNLGAAFEAASIKARATVGSRASLATKTVLVSSSLVVVVVHWAGILKWLYKLRLSRDSPKQTCPNCSKNSM